MNFKNEKAVLDSHAAAVKATFDMRIWRKTLRKNVRALTIAKAREIYDAHAARGPGIGDPAYRTLTGGYSSQSIDFEVTRALATHCGIIKTPGFEQRKLEETLIDAFKQTWEAIANDIGEALTIGENREPKLTDRVEAVIDHVERYGDLSKEELAAYRLMFADRRRSLARKAMRNYN